MKLIPEELYVTCLEALENGDSVARILARYPEFADELRPFLATAVQLTHLPIQPTLAAKHTSAQQFLRHAADLRTAAKLHQSRRRWYQLLAPVFSLIFLLVVGGSLVMASNMDQPGNALSGARQWVESFLFTPTTEPEATAVPEPTTKPKPSPESTQTPRPQQVEVVEENTIVPTATDLVENIPTSTPTPTKIMVMDTAVPSPTSPTTAPATATTQPVTPTVAATPVEDDHDNDNENNSDDDKNDNSGEDNNNDNDDGENDSSDNANDNANDNDNSDDENDENDNSDNANDNDDDDNSNNE